MKPLFSLPSVLTPRCLALSLGVAILATTQASNAQSGLSPTPPDSVEVTLDDDIPAGPRPTATVTPLQTTPAPTATVTPLPVASPDGTQPRTTNTVAPSPTPTPSPTASPAQITNTVTPAPTLTRPRASSADPGSPSAAPVRSLLGETERFD